MSYLLDTHAFLWWIMDDPQLPHALRDRLESFPEPIYLSVISIWEIVLKFKLRKLKMPEPVEPYLLRHIQKNRFELLTLHSNHVFQTLSLPAHHRDPFDRMLIAQAQTENLILVTRDPEIQRYPITSIWN